MTRDLLSALMGIGLYVLAQIGLDWNTRRAEPVVREVRSACAVTVRGRQDGKLWEPIRCAKFKETK